MAQPRRMQTFADELQRVPQPYQRFANAGQVPAAFRNLSPEEFARLKLQADNEAAIKRMQAAAKNATDLFSPPAVEQGRAHFPIYRADAAVKPMPAPLPRKTERQPLTPAQQEAYDAQLDYLDEYTAVDELGNRHMARPLSELGINLVPRNLQREMDALAEADRVAKSTRADRGKGTPKKPPQRI